MGRVIKRFVYGFLVFFASYIVIQISMGALYAAASKPFYGSIGAGVAYSLLRGILCLLLCRYILVRFTDSRLADHTTIAVAITVMGIILFAGFWTFIADNLPNNSPSILPTIAIWVPWFVAAIIAANSIRHEQRPPKGGLN